MWLQLIRWSAYVASAAKPIVPLRDTDGGRLSATRLRFRRPPGAVCGDCCLKFPLNLGRRRARHAQIGAADTPGFVLRVARRSADVLERPPWPYGPPLSSKPTRRSQPPLLAHSASGGASLIVAAAQLFRGGLAAAQDPKGANIDRRGIDVTPHERVSRHLIGSPAAGRR